MLLLKSTACCWMTKKCKSKFFPLLRENPKHKDFLCFYSSSFIFSGQIMKYSVLVLNVLIMNDPWRMVCTSQGFIMSEIFWSWLKNARIFWRIIIAKSGNTASIKFVCRSRLWFGCGFSLFVWIGVFDKNSLHFEDQMVLLVRKISFVYQLLQHVANWSLTSLQQSFLVRLPLGIQGFFYQ